MEWYWIVLIVVGWLAVGRIAYEIGVRHESVGADRNGFELAAYALIAPLSLICVVVIVLFECVLHDFTYWKRFVKAGLKADTTGGNDNE